MQKKRGECDQVPCRSAAGKGIFTYITLCSAPDCLLHYTRRRVSRSQAVQHELLLPRVVSWQTFPHSWDMGHGTPAALFHNLFVPSGAVERGR